jgi:hypothetical protein
MIRIISEIKRQVEATAQKRRVYPPNAADDGMQLLRHVKGPLEQLKEMRDEELQYISTADKEAEELLQCAIDSCNDTVAEELLQCAIDSYNDFHSKFEKYLPGLKDLIDSNPVETVDNARKLLNTAKPLLVHLKNVMISSSYSTSAIETLFNQGQSMAVGIIVKNRYNENAGVTQGLDAKDFYLMISALIASKAEQMCVVDVNAIPSSRDLVSISKLKEVVTKALEVYDMIDKMDLMPEYREMFNEKRSQLSDLAADIERAIKRKEEERRELERISRRANWIYAICIILGMSAGLFCSIAGGSGKIIGGLAIGFFGGWIVSFIVKWLFRLGDKKGINSARH